jgi:hypothetical protein
LENVKDPQKDVLSDARPFRDTHTLYFNLPKFTTQFLQIRNPDEAPETISYKTKPTSKTSNSQQSISYFGKASEPVAVHHRRRNTHPLNTPRQPPVVAFPALLVQEQLLERAVYLQGPSGFRIASWPGGIPAPERRQVSASHWYRMAQALAGP